MTLNNSPRRDERERGQCVHEVLSAARVALTGNFRYFTDKHINRKQNRQSVRRTVPAIILMVRPVVKCNNRNKCSTVKEREYVCECA